MADNDRADTGSYRDTDSVTSATTAEHTGSNVVSPQHSRFSGSVRHRPAGLEPARTYGSFHTAPLRSAAPPKTPKRAPLSKRQSSSSHVPHRKEFSVDDSQQEVDQDNKLARTTSHTLRRQASTISRRAGIPSQQYLHHEDQQHADPSRPAHLIIERHPSSGESDDTLRPDHDQDERPSTEPVEEPPFTDASMQPSEADDDDPDLDDDDDDMDPDQDDDSDAESFTLKDRQQAINETHPFGIRIWKPALYKKDRSIQANAEGDIHSPPGGYVNYWLFIFNITWTLVFGWWLAIIAAIGGALCRLVSLRRESPDYGTPLLHLAVYIFYPFGRSVKLEHEEDYMHEDENEGRSVTDYERWQTGHLEEGRLFFGPTENERSLVGQRRDSDSIHDETDSLLGRSTRRRRASSTVKSKKRPFGRGKWTAGRVVYFAFFYAILTPAFLLVSGICYFLVFTIPMARVTSILLNHLRRHPLALTFHSEAQKFRDPDSAGSSVLLCTYRAVGHKYWKYTIDGTNIILVNLLSTVVFAVVDYYVLRETLHLDSIITSSGFVFILSLLSVIPLAYFIGQAVASISAQSTMGVGATVNAFFSTVVEVYLYCVALNQGKARLVEGSVIGSIFAGILLMPGMSMCFGAIKRKTQRFNVRSAGVTSTMLMFAIIGLFGPTLFYEIYGSHELACHQCIEVDPQSADRDCRRCYYSQAPAVQDRFFMTAVRPYIWFCAALLFLSYLIGLLFTLRTHAAIIWSTELDEKKIEKMENHHNEARSALPEPSPRHASSAVTTGHKDNVRDTQLYKRILGQSLRHAGYSDTGAPRSLLSAEISPIDPKTPFLAPPKGDGSDKLTHRGSRIPGLSTEDNQTLIRQVAELAATAATVAARDGQRPLRKVSHMSSVPATASRDHFPATPAITEHSHTEGVNTVDESVTLAPNHDANAQAGGHDAPNWSKTKSCVILLTATVAYAIIAEILVDTVDSVLDNVDIDEKFLGIMLFALVPNTTEFLNAISFAMNGNIALSMEIGSAYALQVMLLQAPALVLFSAYSGQYIDPAVLANHTFSLIFPQWDMVTVILGLFLMNYVIGEGKSNYFKGSMLILSWLVVIMGFWLTGFDDDDAIMGIDRFDTLAMNKHVQTFSTVGRTKSGLAR